jgi:hypothetical protein
MASAFWCRIIVNHGVTAVMLFWLSRPSVYVRVSILCFRGWMPLKTMSTAFWWRIIAN